MLTIDSTFREMFLLLKKQNITLMRIESFLHLPFQKGQVHAYFGWNILMRSPKGVIFEIRNTPDDDLPKAITSCVRKILEKEQGTVEDLIARSSLGTPEAVAIRKSAPKHVVDEVLRRVDEKDRKKRRRAH